MVHCRLTAVYLLTMWLTACCLCPASQESILWNIAVLGKNQNSKFEAWFPTECLLLLYSHKVKKNCKLNHHKSVTAYGTRTFPHKKMFTDKTWRIYLKKKNLEHNCHRDFMRCSTFSHSHLLVVKGSTSQKKKFINGSVQLQRTQNKNKYRDCDLDLNSYCSVANY